MSTIFSPLVLLAAAALLLAGCDNAEMNADGETAAARPVISIAVHPLQTDHLRMAGIVVPRFITELGFPAMGRLIARNVSVGDIVKTGDSLAALEATSLELTVQAAQADVQLARAQLENATGALDRQTVLQQAGIVSQTVLEATSLQVTAASMRVESAEANLVQAKQFLADAELVAEVDGVVTAIGGQVGEVLPPGQPIVTVARTDQRDAVIDVPEVLASSIAGGDGFDVLLELDRRLSVRGAVRDISPQADPVTRTRRVWIALENPPASFRFGTNVFARPDIAADEALYALPASALFETDAGSFVWVVDPQTNAVHARRVQVKARANGTVVVLDSLTEGERVVTAGIGELADGQIVRLEQDSQS